MSIAVALADDHPVIRRGLRVLLEGQPDIDVVGDAPDGLEAVNLLSRVRVDVLVLDLMMPGLSGLEVLRILPERSPRTRVVVLSMYSSRAFVAEALKTGACGYVLKGAGEQDILTAVREAAAGRRFLSPPVTQIAVDEYVKLSASGTFDPHETLTAREREVLQMAAEGRTACEIGARLHISPRTVENHRSRLMRKLGLATHSDLVRHALRHGLITLDE